MTFSLIYWIWNKTNEKVKILLVIYNLSCIIRKKDKLNLKHYIIYYYLLYRVNLIKDLKWISDLIHIYKILHNKKFSFNII